MATRTIARGLSATSPASAIAEGGLLADAFHGPTWNRWRAILKAAYGEPLDADELALFREVAEREPPGQRVRELWAIAGRRSGKDSVASAIATVAALGDYTAHLRPGERASILCLAVDREQARIIHRYVAGYFAEIPLLHALVERETDDGLELTNRVEIVIATNSFRAVRGRTIACAIFDEVAYWRADDSAYPDTETYNAILPGMTTLPGAILVGISSPHRRGGLLYERWRAAYGKDDHEVLVVKGPTRLFNPNVPQRIIDAALERDPEAGAAEWLAEWRSDLSDFVPRDVVDAVVASGVVEIPPAEGTAYAAFVDPSGGSSDSMTLAVAHADSDGRAVLDCLREVWPPFSPESVVGDFATTLRAYNVGRVRGDRFGGDWPAERFRENGIDYEVATESKSDLYRELLPLLTGRRAQLLDHRRLAAQLCALERRVVRGGRDSIDHPKGLHDDLANAAAGALVAVATDAAPSLIRREDLKSTAANKMPVPLCIAATYWPTVSGKFAVVYTALPASADRLYISDIVEGQQGMETLRDVASRLHELFEEACRPGRRCPHVFLYVPPPLRSRASIALGETFAHDLDAAHVSGRKIEAALIPEWLTKDFEAIALAAAGHVHDGKVRLTETATAKTGTVPLHGALAVRMGERIDDDPLRVAALLAIRLGLGPQ